MSHEEEEDDEILREFLIESYENLDQLDQAFVELEAQPEDLSQIAGIFRTIHTIKGASGFLGLDKLQALTHVGESLLSQLRDGKRSLDEACTTVLLQMVDAVREILQSLEQTGGEGVGTYETLVDELKRLQEICGPQAVSKAPSAAAVENIDDVPVPVGELLVKEGATTREEVERAYAQQQSGDERPIGQILVENEGAAPKEVLRALRTQQESTQTSVAENSVRIDVTLLDTLMNLVGELVLARNQVLQFGSSHPDPAFQGTTQRLNLITSELQEGVMKTRMQPIGSIWNKFPRVVRDLAKSCEKRVRIELVGKETELDRTIIEAIKDPLVHIVRNAVDHGIERPERRVELGKSEVGLLTMRAYHEGGQVNIEISDDGGGIDVERVREKAIAKGIVTSEVAQRMGHRELTNLIFAPGFSTASSITNVSGRGVGMDVVRTNIEKIGGTLDVVNRFGEGTSLKIKIPLTLAIIPALLVQGGTERFAIPQVNLIELVRLEGADARGAIEDVHGTPVYRLRGNLLPIVDLREVFDIRATDDGADGTSGNHAEGIGTDGALNIVVLRADERSFGLVVDAVHDTEEIVVKPLGKELKSVVGFAGATILGDGRVSLILDVLGVAQMSKVLTEGQRTRASEGRDAQGEDVSQADSLLVVKSAGSTNFGLQLAQVDRLEEVNADSLQHAGGRDAIHYRGKILPLVYLSDLVEPRVPSLDSATLQIVVVKHQGRTYGVVVEEVLDIVDERFELADLEPKPGFIGSTIVHDRMVDLVDLPQALDLIQGNAAVAREMDGASQ